MKRPTSKEYIGFRTSKYNDQRLRAYAEQYKMSLTNFIEFLIEQGLNKIEEYEYNN